MSGTVAVVLAAGLGTRMKSSKQKGLHTVAGRPLIYWPIRAAVEAGFDKVTLVVGHQADAVEAAVRRLFPNISLGFAIQKEQLGTAHATLCAREECIGFSRVVVINGDLPLLRPATLMGVVKALDESEAPFALLSAELPDPTGFGRILRDELGPLRIVEERDATREQKAIREANVGVYAAHTSMLFELLSSVGTSNAAREFYFTDAVEILRSRGQRVGVHSVEDVSECIQVNDRIGLATVERLLFEKKARALMEAGVTIRQPWTVAIDDDCTIGPDTEIQACVELHASEIGSGCFIGRGVVLTNMRVGNNVTIKPYSVATDSVIEDGCQIGPFAHLRPGSVLKRDVHVGNFVETKKSVIGEGSKANHLSYLGDCTVGSKVNIGAGTITCNYDGVNKLPTVIEDGAFIGSDTQLVAPVKVGKDAYVGAGTTVTKDVPDGALAISRVAQVHVLGYAERRRPKKKH